MFGKNEILKKDHGGGTTLHVVKGSPFLTIQGEGPYSGRPAIFLRLHGCHLACIFCDTLFSDPADPRIPIQKLLLAINGLFARGTWTDQPLVVITGGEPMRQNIGPLCMLLHKLGYLVQIETAGSFWIPGITDDAELVVSPKTKTVAREVALSASAFKYVISTDTRFENGVPVSNTQGRREERLAAPMRGDTPIYLSPMDEYDSEKNKANIKYVGEMALRYGYRAMCQLHKLLDLD